MKNTTTPTLLCTVSDLLLYIIYLVLIMLSRCDTSDKYLFSQNCIVLWSVTGPERQNAAVRIISINVPGKWEERGADLTPLFCIKLSVFPFLLNKVSQPVSLNSRKEHRVRLN